MGQWRSEYKRPSSHGIRDTDHKFNGSIHCGGTRGRTRTGTAVKPEDFKSSMSTIPSRGHSGEHRQNAGRVKADSLQIRAQIRDQIPICGEWVQSQLSSKLNFCQLWLSEGQMGQAFARQGPKMAR